MSYTLAVYIVYITPVCAILAFRGGPGWPRTNWKELSRKTY